MRLTAFTDYSLRTLMYVGTNRGKRTTIAEIAAAFGISENHLVKCVHFLATNGWLRSIRGHGGGLELALAPAQINVGQVVRQTEGKDVPAECFDRDTNTCPITSSCQLARVLSQAVDAFYAVLDEYTLEDLLRNRTTLARIL